MVFQEKSGFHSVSYIFTSFLSIGDDDDGGYEDNYDAGGAEEEQVEEVTTVGAAVHVEIRAPEFR